MQSAVPQFALSQTSGDDGLAAFATAVRDVFAVTPQPGDDGPATLSVRAWHLGTMMLGSFSGPPLAFHRSPSLVASSGLDHLLVQLYVSGGFEGRADERLIRVCPGDICVFDLRRTLQTRAGAFSNISILVPRSLLTHELRDTSALHGLVLPVSNCMAGLLADHIVSLEGRMASLTQAQALRAASVTSSLIATILAGEVVELTGHSAEIDSPLRKVIRYVDQNISNGQLDAKEICDRLGMSRASLYRLFESSGGLARYIRHRRLSGAALDLADSTRQLRIGAIAAAWGYPDAGSFSRAFRNAFGITPQQAREYSLAFLAHASEGPEESTVSSARFAEWMRTLVRQG